MPDNIPQAGDVVIHSSGSHTTLSFAVRAVPGPDQFGCETRGEAERMARSYAERSGVDLWFSDGPSGFTLLARFRGAAHRRPGERRHSMVRSLGNASLGEHHEKCLNAEADRLEL